mmetsp:Transcript_2868/g.6417  ORF Transcript_2868/g.6417 Transcript_2868/m.6417 type:complete len:286 (+) Transcript_2868:571-1428(+)
MQVARQRLGRGRLVRARPPRRLQKAPPKSVGGLPLLGCPSWRASWRAGRLVQLLDLLRLPGLQGPALLRLETAQLGATHGPGAGGGHEASACRRRGRPSLQRTPGVFVSREQDPARGAAHGRHGALPERLLVSRLKQRRGERGRGLGLGCCWARPAGQGGALRALDGQAPDESGGREGGGRVVELGGGRRARTCRERRQRRKEKGKVRLPQVLPFFPSRTRTHHGRLREALRSAARSGEASAPGAFLPPLGEAHLLAPPRPKVLAPRGQEFALLPAGPGGGGPGF